MSKRFSRSPRFRRAIVLIFLFLIAFSWGALRRRISLKLGRDRNRHRSGREGFAAHFPDASAVFTPYHLTPGGGERVVLSFIMKFQEYTNGPVELIVQRDNTCQNVHCLMKLSEALMVRGIRWNAVSIKTPDQMKNKYRLWFAMGNSMWPPMPSKGLFSIYHCQFPFDGQHPPSPAKNLLGYDIVYFNSEYTKGWYRNYLREHIDTSGDQSLLSQRMPMLINFPPPFKTAPKAHPGRTHLHFFKTFQIILIGRFFEGVQCKRHKHALEAFKMLKQKSMMVNLKLYLVGHVATGHEAYAAEVMDLASEINGAEVLLNADDSTITSLLFESDVIWSITGLELEAPLEHVFDPADAEHFGLALLEGMFEGLVPVVFDRGGPTEIAKDLPDFLKVSSLSGLVQSTAQLMHMNPYDLDELKSHSKRVAEGFAAEFDSGISMLFSFLELTLDPSNQVLWLMTRKNVLEHENRANDGWAAHDNRPLQADGACRSIDTDTAALIYADTRPDFALRAIVSQLTRKVGPDWRLHVFHSIDNHQISRDMLFGFSCVVYHSLDNLYLSKPGSFDPRNEGSYQTFWKSGEVFKALGKNVKHVLTFQADSWFPPNGVFKTAWLQLDYIGAPWCHIAPNGQMNWGYLESSERPEEANPMLHDTRRIPFDIRVGNGGISLRNSQAQILTAGRHVRDALKYDQENEDVFFVVSLLEDGFTLGTLEQAAQFGAEILCHDIDAHRKLKASARSKLRHLTVPFSIHKPFDVFFQLQLDPERYSDVRLFLQYFFEKGSQKL